MEPDKYEIDRIRGFYGHLNEYDRDSLRMLVKHFMHIALGTEADRLFYNSIGNLWLVLKPEANKDANRT
jgi:hypothetical protein